jgi:hypothetical protein
VIAGIFLQVIQLDSDWSLEEKQLSAAIARAFSACTSIFLPQQIIIGMLATCSLLICPELTPAASSESTETTQRPEP